MKIKISDSALDYVKRKTRFYSSRNRKPRLIRVAKTCQGARFAVVFGFPLAGENAVSARELELYLAPELLSEYQGFEISTEVFFFTRRLLINPVQQSYACDCDTKCANRHPSEDK